MRVTSNRAHPVWTIQSSIIVSCVIRITKLIRSTNKNMENKNRQEKAAIVLLAFENEEYTAKQRMWLNLMFLTRKLQEAGNVFLGATNFYLCLLT